MAQEGLWNIAKKRMLEDLGALRCLKKRETLSGNTLPCTKKSFLGGWLREDVVGMAEEMKGHERRQEMKKERFEGETERVELTVSLDCECHVSVVQSLNPSVDEF